MKKKLAVIVIAMVMVVSLLLTGCGAGYQENAADILSFDLTSFKGKDIDGQKVTKEIFKDYDVTMVNVFETTCQHCIEEMPALEQLHQDLPDNVNIIGICTDGDQALSTLKKEVAKTGVTYTVIAGNKNFRNMISDSITAYPTTFFVNSKGEIVGPMNIGEPGDSDDSDSCEVSAQSCDNSSDVTDETTQSIVDAYTDLINKALDA